MQRAQLPALQVESGHDEIVSMQEVLAAEGGQAPKSLLPDALCILQGKPSKVRAGAWVYDVVDAILEKNTRAFMGDDPRGGPPVPIDKWAYRDLGYIDSEMKSWLINKGYSEATDVKVDCFNDETYEYAAEKYISFAKKLNEEAWNGNDWLPHQVQAVGRVTMQIMMGVKPRFPEDIIPDQAPKGCSH